MANEQNLKPFQKGDDPRRNRNGRPKSFDALRKLAQQIATEDVKQGGQPLIIDGHKVTVIEAVMRALASSKNPRDRELFLKYAYGAPPTAVEVSGKDGGPVQHEHKGQTHGDVDHLAAVLATLVGVGAVALPDATAGVDATDDGLHPA